MDESLTVEGQAPLPKCPQCKGETHIITPATKKNLRITVCMDADCAHVLEVKDLEV